MDPNFYLMLPETVQTMLVGAGGDFMGGLAAQAVSGLFSAGGRRLARRFEESPREVALRRAMANALAATALEITDDDVVMEHLLGLLGDWLDDEDVQIQLCTLLDPSEQQSPDIDILTTAMDRLDLDAELLSPDHTFAAIIALFADKLTDALDQEPELQGELQTRLLRHMAEQITAQLAESKQQTAYQKRTTETLEQAHPMDPASLIPAYLRGVYKDCIEIPLVREERSITPQKQPNLQRVYVDLDTTATPDLLTMETRLDKNGIDTQQLRKTIQAILRARSRRHPEPAAGDGRIRPEDPLEWLLLLQEDERQELAKTSDVDMDLLTAARARMSVLEMLSQQRQFVLLGDPGSGKSTLTRRLAAMLAALGCDDVAAQLDEDSRAWAQGLRGYLRRAHLPVRVVLSRWAKHAPSTAPDDPPPGTAKGNAGDLVQECLRQLHVLGAPGTLLDEWFMAHLTANEPSVLLLLDGLDEVADPTRRAWIVSAIDDFCGHYASVPLVVTCRVRPYEEGEHYALPLPVAKLAPLTDGAIQRFIERWYAELTRAGRYAANVATAKRRHLADELTSQRRQELRDMAGIPLLLTMMAHVNYAHVLPDNRAQLYELFTNQLLWQWEQLRQSEYHEQETSLAQLFTSHGVDKTGLDDTLNKLAYTVHGRERNERDTVDIPRADVWDALVALHPRGEKAGAGWALDVLDLIDARSGLLYAREKKRVYSFTHRTFQEYMAARWLAGGDTDTVIEQYEEHIDDEQWREVIFLGLSYQVKLRSDYDNALAVLEVLLPNSDNVASLTPAAWRRVLLLGEAYVKLGGTEIGQKCRAKARVRYVDDAMETLLTAAMQNPALPPDQRLDAGILAAELGLEPPRLDDFLPLDDWMTTPNGAHFRIARYPVTNAQYRRFVDADGYATERFWSTEGRERRNQEKWTEPRYWQNGRLNHATQPVVGVSWYEAGAYCIWLTEQLRAQGKIGAGEEARLPTQAEWEAAARSRHGKQYPWGSDEFDPARANTEESKLERTTPVHMYPDGATPDGVWDLAGNVWEWTRDKHNWGYRLCGGAWWSDASDVGASARHWGPPAPQERRPRVSGGRGPHLSLVLDADFWASGF